MANLKYISSFIISGQTRGIKWTVPSDFLAKKKQLSFYEGLRTIAASIKEGLLLLRSTIVLWAEGLFSLVLSNSHTVSIFFSMTNIFQGRSSGSYWQLVFLNPF